MQIRLLVPAFIALSMTAYPQAADTPYQTRYAANLKNGDSVINMINTGASSTVAFPNQNGALCANVYAFSPDNKLISCCACPINSNALVSLSVKKDIVSNSANTPAPNSVVLSVLASVAGSNTTCALSATTVGTGSNVLATGLAAWGTTVHLAPAGVTETAFTPSTLSAAELTRMITLCSFINTNGGGAGICKACRTGGLSTPK